MASVTVIMYTPVVNHMRGWSGDVGMSVHRLANMMAVGQREMAPKKTGALVAQIRVGDREHWARGIAISVGANPGERRRGYALWTSEGAAPHRIVPKASNRSGTLNFFWAKVGRYVRLRSVNHPGIRRPTHWVTGGAEIGMRVWS